MTAREKILLFALAGTAAGYVAWKYATPTADQADPANTYTPGDVVQQDIPAVDTTTAVTGYFEQGWNIVKTAFGAGMRRSIAGVQTLLPREKYVGTQYLDSNGHPTIGYGHMIKPGESFSYLTQAQAYQLFLQDLKPVEDGVASRLRVGVTQGQFDALTSFAFNIGIGNFAKSTLLALVNAGRMNDARALLPRTWVGRPGSTSYNGLLARRAEELNLWDGTIA